jgi:predicted nucleotidyltransferase
MGDIERLPSHVREALKELHSDLSRIYGRDLEKVAVFGSYARGDQRPGSDLDVVAVVSDFDDYWTEVKRTSDLVARLSLQYGFTVALQIMRRSEWESDQSPLSLNIREEGIAA